MRFWRKKDAGDGASSVGSAATSSSETRRQPTKPPVKGTKVRVFLQPPGRIARLLEVVLPDDDADDDVSLRCFEPPPEGGAASGESSVRAWTVDLDTAAVSQVRDQAAAIKLLPVGGRSAAGDGSTVELTIAAGSAEARLTWWMAPPLGWSAASDLVDGLRRLSGEKL